MTTLLLHNNEAPRAVESDGREFPALAGWLETGQGRAVRLGPADDPFALAGKLDAIDAIAVEFPKATDGRGYSTARLLRERLGWKGELRAVGDVAYDQLAFMVRCGFDALALREGEDAGACLKAFAEMSVRYQGDVHDGRPLFRRRHEALAALAEAKP